MTREQKDKIVNDIRNASDVTVTVEHLHGRWFRVTRIGGKVVLREMCKQGPYVFRHGRHSVYSV